MESTAKINSREWAENDNRENEIIKKGVGTLGGDGRMRCWFKSQLQMS